MTGIIERRNLGTPEEAKRRGQQTAKDSRGYLSEHPEVVAKILASIGNRAPEREAMAEDIGQRSVSALGPWQISTAHPGLLRRKFELRRGGSYSPSFHYDTATETPEQAALEADASLRAEGWPIPLVEAYVVADVVRRAEEPADGNDRNV